MTLSFWRYRIPRRPRVWWYVQGRKAYAKQFASIKRMWGCGDYHGALQRQIYEASYKSHGRITWHIKHNAR